MAGNTSAKKAHEDTSNNFQAMRESLKKELLDTHFRMGDRSLENRFDSVNKQEF